jgi:hypothetical protein
MVLILVLEVFFGSIGDEQLGKNVRASRGRQAGLLSECNAAEIPERSALYPARQPVSTVCQPEFSEVLTYSPFVMQRESFTSRKIISPETRCCFVPSVRIVATPQKLKLFALLAFLESA